MHVACGPCDTDSGDNAEKEHAGNSQNDHPQQPAAADERHKSIRGGRREQHSGWQQKGARSATSETIRRMTAAVKRSGA